jgi:hypothetical protein
MNPMTRLVVRSVLVVIAMLIGVVGSTVVDAQAKKPIQPGEHFVGIVNGRRVKPVVYTVCGGPSTPGRTGPILQGQKVSVARVAKGGGSTGLFSVVHVWIVQDVSADGPQQVDLTRFGTGRNLPSAARVPCDGTGQVAFSSCPPLAPCAFGWVPDLVTVQFVNVAV